MSDINNFLSINGNYFFFNDDSVNSLSFLSYCPTKLTSSYKCGKSCEMLVFPTVPTNLSLSLSLPHTHTLWCFGFGLSDCVLFLQLHKLLDFLNSITLKNSVISIRNKKLPLMTKQKIRNALLVHLVILFFFSTSVVSARVVSLLQNYGNPIFRSNFHSIYDTSKYGVFQLSNGLGKTPQMGFDSRFLSLSLTLLLLVE